MLRGGRPQRSTLHALTLHVDRREGDMQGLEGIYVIVSTPFDERGRLDEESFAGLLDATVRAGVQGVTILGVAGEAQRLSDAERDRLLARAMEAVAGRIPVVVG